MAGIGEAPVAITKTAAWAATSSGKIALEAGKDMLGRVRTEHKTREGIPYQDAFRPFVRKFSVVNFEDLDKGRDEGEDLETRALLAADTLADGGLLDDQTAVEVRLLMPEESLEDPVLSKRRERVLEILGLALEEEHNILNVASYPITPSRYERSPTSVTTAPHAIAPELDGLALQFQEDPRYEPAMLAITGSAYERRLFGGHVAVVGNPTGSNVFALDNVGRRVQDNTYAWEHPATQAA